MKIRKRKIIYLILFISIIILLFNSFKGPSISYDEDIILKNDELRWYREKIHSPLC